MLQMITMGSLFDRPVHDPGLKRVKHVIAVSLPAGWRNWMVISRSLDDAVDMAHKARFAIPSVNLFQALVPNSANISERLYKKLKGVLLSWPLGKALLCFPHLQYLSI